MRRRNDDQRCEGWSAEDGLFFVGGEIVETLELKGEEVRVGARVGGDGR